MTTIYSLDYLVLYRLDQVQHMALTSAARTDFHDAPIIDEHWHHRRRAYGTVGCAGQFHTTMWTVELHDCVHGDVQLG